MTRYARGRSTPARLVLRARIVLAAAEGSLNKDIAKDLDTDANTVGKWRLRFVSTRLAGIERDAPRGGRPSTSRDRLAKQIVEATTRTKPEDAPHWSTRTLARRLRTNRSMVQRVWNANGLKPHLIQSPGPPRAGGKAPRAGARGAKTKAP